MTTVTLGDNTTNTYTGTQDNVLYTSTGNLQGLSDSGGGNILIRWTGWSNIPAGATITAVTLTIKCVTGQLNSGNLKVRKVLRAVTESGSNWSTYDGTNNWTTAGCLGDGTDREATNLCTLTYPGSFGAATYTSDSTSAFIAWAQGVLDSNTTPWLYLEMVNGASGINGEAYALSAGTNGDRPFLTVTFTEAGGSFALEETGIVCKPTNFDRIVTIHG